MTERSVPGDVVLLETCGGLRGGLASVVCRFSREMGHNASLHRIR